MAPIRKFFIYHWPIVLMAFVGIQVLVLGLMGVPWMCECGVKFWEGGILNGQTSQHVLDWYAPSHVVHGILFYALIVWVRPRTPLSLRMLLAVVLEIAWEIFENTPWVIERYRTATAAVDYSGDTIINSVSDVGLMFIGFYLASRLPIKWVVAIVLVAELIALWAIRDGLLLQIMTFIWPIDALVDWQSRA